MRRAYKALLHGDRVEWLDGAPETDGPVPVSITIADESYVEALQDSREPVSELFEALAISGAFADIEDAVAWQREQRKDRPLPYPDSDAD